jgi:hypothetical protein
MQGRGAVGTKQTNKQLSKINTIRNYFIIIISAHRFTLAKYTSNLNLHNEVFVDTKS